MTERRLPLVLVAGGLYEEVGPQEFWEGPRIAPALRRLGWTVHVPDRPARPRSWDEEAVALAATVDRLGEPAGVVAASNGCSAALRLAVDRPELVAHLVLCWPATGDDPTVEHRERQRLAGRGVDAAAVRQLLDGELVRGVRPDELRSLAAPAVLVPADPEDDHHQHRTVAGLRRTMRHAVVGLATPPSPHPAFAPHLPALVSLLDVVLAG